MMVLMLVVETALLVLVRTINPITSAPAKQSAARCFIFYLAVENV